MPYIKQKDRDRLRTDENYFPKNKGELNFVITTLMYHYLKQNKTSYQNISDCIAACNDAGEEFRRRVMNPYEDKKIKENGDID
jgi:hypothetical protein